MLLLELTPSAWIVWAIIGIIGGYTCGRLLTDGPSVLVNLIVGILGSTLGGWLFVRFFGDDDRSIYISLLTSALLCAILLWILYLIFRKRGTERDS